MLLILIPSSLAYTEIQYSLDNSTWKNATSTNANRTIIEELDDGINYDEDYYFRMRMIYDEHISAWTYVTTKTKDVSESPYFYTYIFLFIIAGILLVMGYVMEQPYFIIFTGIIFIGIALNINNTNFINMENLFLKNIVITAIAGLGFYFIIRPSIEVIGEYK